MKISLNWLKKYVNVPEGISDAELIRLIGARLVEVEGVIDETRKYDNIYIVRVVSCEKIPDTHLTLCQIDAGSSPFRGLPEVTTEDEGASPVTTGASDPSRERTWPASIQVVCGAPNVREGMLAVWIAPGAVVPASIHEDAPFVIGERKMRGYESAGMLAGADELDFGDDHSGIVEIDPAVAKPGDTLADVFELNDLVLEIENKSLTHRPDCFGMIGFAREVAGILGEEFDFELQQACFACGSLHAGQTSQNLAGSAPGAIRYSTREDFRGLLGLAQCSQNTLTVVLDPTICQRYTAVVLRKHGELKKKYLTWQDTILAKSGMRPVDPIVDVTNYLMLLTGQPLHAFDYDKFVVVGSGSKAKINVRLARAGEKLILLDDKEILLNESDIVICSGDTPVALAGAMGGKATEIDENSKNILIESATFSLYNLRKTQMAHGIFSEAITRFTKGQPAEQTFAVAEACVEMLSSGFEVVEVADQYPNPEKEIVVKITTDEIDKLLGTEYDRKLIIRTLSNVGFIVDEKDGALMVSAPKWRTDIHIKEDIIEEVGRLLGYDNIQPTLPLHRTAQKNVNLEIKKTIRELMRRLGANEVLTYGFLSEKLLEKTKQDVKNSYKIVNSISPDLQYVRQSLIPSLLEKTYMNEKLPVDRFAIFEMNKVYQKELGVDAEGVPVEKAKMGFVVAERKNNETAYYKAKKYVDAVLGEFGVKVKYVPVKTGISGYQFFEPKRTAEIRLAEDESVLLGVVGEFKNSVKHEFKLADYLAGFEVDIDLVEKYNNLAHTIRFGEITTEDLTVTTDKSYAEAFLEVQQKYPDAEITPGAIYQAENQTTRNITFHIVSYR